jgi:tricorn protease
VSLSRLTEDPNDPLVRERVRRSAPAAGRGGRGGGAGPDSTVGPSRIDLPDIEKRAIQLTRGTVGVSSFFLSNDGHTVYFAVGGGVGGRGGGGRGGAAADDAAAGLFSVGIDGRDRRRIAAGTFAGMQPTADRRTIFFRAPGRAADSTQTGAPAAVGFEINRLAIAGAGGGGAAGGAGGGAPGGAGGGAGGATAQRGDRVNFSFQVRVDRRAEWKEMFSEVWRVMKYRYYDESMNNRDWAAIRTKYEPLLKYVGTNEDVYDLGNAMIGEINSSHTGVSGPPTYAMPEVYRTHFLGVELEAADGKYRISHVYRNGPADKEWLDLKAGDYVLAINGEEIKAGDNYWKILSGVTNDYVPVKVAKAPNGENARTVRIASVTSLNNIKYEEWVADNRDQVEKATGGEIAYVHIRAMDQPSLARFENEIDRYWNKKGIIVDIRNNGGGNIDQELLDILERRPYEFWNNRNGSRTWGRRPRQAIAGPKVMLVNGRSASDAEVTPMGFRELGLGRIVGNPTSAQVIATGSYALINGGAVRTPGSLVVTYDPSKPNNYGVNLENYGVAPDVWVKNSPMDEVKGMDRELKAAIDEVLKMLKETAGKRITND